MKTILTFLLLLSCNMLSAQQTDAELSALIIRQDSLFWDAYNRCDTSALGSFFTSDVEFYHDKGGPTIGLPALVRSFSKNLCSNSNWHLKREPVPGSYKVFPLKKDNAIYGAVLSGEHVFYILEAGKGPMLDGHASFTHLWLKKDGVWKMKNVLSYDHGPATYQNKRQEISLPEKVLSAYVGTYQGANVGEVQIAVEKGVLVMKIKDKVYRLYAEKEDVFFDKDRDLVFEFEKERKMTVKENGVVAEVLPKIK